MTASTSSASFKRKRLGLPLFLVLATFPLVAPQGRSCFNPQRVRVKCRPEDRYRSISGACNNLENPEWGTAGRQLVRILPPDYEDKRDEPRGGLNSRTLPNPRWMSQRNHPDEDLPDSRYTHMVMQFGQFLDHDITLTPKDEEINCCKGDSNDNRCFVIPIPPRDRFYSWVNLTATCMNLVRSTPVCQQSERQQYNAITAFVDASNVYGSDRDHAAVLRTYRNGLLASTKATNQLPTIESLNLRPNVRLLRPQTQADFVAGDERVNEHPFLTSMHVLFMREHNRIAKLVGKYLPKNLRQDELIYQETRRIVSAEMQNIVYGEYLPTILGAKYMKKYGLLVEEATEYKARVQPEIINSFASAAFRFGHSMINSMFMLVSQRKPRNQDKTVTWFWRLREIFDGQKTKGDRLPLENMLEGLISQMPQTCDAYFSTEITNHLFQKNERRENFGLDLLAINIQRGRDHGLPSYNSFRKRCGLPPLTSWKARPSELDDTYWLKLKEVYEKVDDIDLMLGGVAEKNVRGGAVGATFACIIGEQFRRLKQGDRYFYTHTGGQSHGLGRVAKSSVLQRTLGDVLCDNSVMDGTQKWVTLQPDSDYNPREKCKEKRKLDLEAITKEIIEEISDNRRSGKGLSTKSDHLDLFFPFKSQIRSSDRGGRRGRGGGGPRGGRNLKKGPFSPACLNINCNSV